MLFLLATLGLVCTAGVYYEFYCQNDTTNTAVGDAKSSSNSTDSPASLPEPLDALPLVDGNTVNTPRDTDTSSTGVVGLEIGGVRIAKESTLLSKIRASRFARVVHAAVISAVVVATISYGIRLGFLFAYKDELGISWVALTYGVFHLLAAVFALVNFALVGYSVFKNLNRDAYSFVGRWASYVIGTLVTVALVVDLLSLFMPQYFTGLTVETVPFETIKTLLGLGTDYPSWINPIIQSGYYYNAYGVYVQLCILLVMGTYAVALTVKLASGVRSDVQAASLVITMLSALMSALYSFYCLIVPSKRVSFVVQVVYMAVTIGGIVYSSYGSLFSWPSMLAIVMTFMQLRLCLNLTLTNSSLFWTLISPFYAFENNTHLLFY